jgi:predicted TIM-barrel fold metal-dependent hydrolase
MVELAKKHGLFLHAHSDVDAVERLFAQWPQARILWAHSGFDSAERVAAMLRKHRNLWCDLAFRTDFVSNNKVDPAWRGTFLEFPDRFMVGTDSYTPERWHYIGEHANWSRAWFRGPAARRRGTHRMEKRRSALLSFQARDPR